MLAKCHHCPSYGPSIKLELGRVSTDTPVRLSGVSFHLAFVRAREKKKRQPLSDLQIKGALPLHVVATEKISFVFEALKISLPLRLAESAQCFKTPFPYKGNKTKLMVTEIPST